MLAFVLERAWDRFRTVGTRPRTVLRSSSVWVLGAGLVLAALLLALPALIEVLAEYTASNGSRLARLLYQLGFVPEDVCTAILARDETHSACGVKSAMTPPGAATVGAASVLGVISAIIGVLASAKSAAGTEKDSSGGLKGLLSKLWAKIDRSRRCRRS